VESAQKVLEDSGSGGDFVSQRQGGGTTGTSTATSSAGLYIRGRRLFVDLAVDKKTASTLTAEKREDGTKIHGKDRRNLYLKMEGRVMAANQHQDAGGKSDNHHGNNNLAWESLPESDQLKRQRAFAEKNTKLRSPLFFINPNRLSIRNLAKHVDEADLKRLVVQATLRGLETNLVSQEDQVAHWRASGETTTRDIIRRINAAKDESNPDGTVIPAFDEKNVKKFIPSVFIDRDFTTNKKEKAPSRGFGFVDFQHHAHALACLRELNNNPYYSEDYVAGGKRAAEMKRSAKRTKTKKKKSEPPSGEFMGHDGRVQVPRLIVDFTVRGVLWVFWSVLCYFVIVFDSLHWCISSSFASNRSKTKQKPKNRLSIEPNSTPTSKSRDLKEGKRY
jgi:RNA recognition motif-containing protein